MSRTAEGIEQRVVEEIAAAVDGGELVAEFDDITAQLTSAPVVTTLHAYATLCAVAVARVKLLEARLATAGKNGGRPHPQEPIPTAA